MKTKWVIFGTGVVIALSVFVIWVRFAPPSDAYRSANAREVHELMLLELLGCWSGTDRVNLKINDSPVPKQMLARIRQKYANAETGLAYGFERTYGPVVFGTGEAVVILLVEDLKWHSRAEVSVRARIYCGVICGNSATYSLSKDSGKWKITSEIDLHVS